MPHILLELSSVLPSLLLLWYILSRDVYREPARIILATFLLGLGATLPVVLLAGAVETLIDIAAMEGPFADGFSRAFLSAAAPEELCKFLVLFFYTSRRREFDEPMDGVVYGVTASLGFATLENILYVAEGGLPVAMVRAATAVPGHAMLGAIMGYYISRARFNPLARKTHLLQALAIPILLHGLYDFPLLSLDAADSLGLHFSEDLVWGLIASSLAVLALEFIIGVRIVNAMRREQLQTAAFAFEIGLNSRPPRSVARHFLHGNKYIVGLAGLLVGGLGVSFGGLITFFFAAGLWVNELSSFSPWLLAIVWFLAGLLPLLAGAAIFNSAIRRLNRRTQF